MDKIKVGYYLLSASADRQKTSTVEENFNRLFIDVPRIQSVTVDYDIVYFLIASGGCESEFRHIFENEIIPDDFFIICDSFNNSLPAGLEILTFITSKFEYKRKLVYLESENDLNLIKKYHDIRKELYNKKIGLIGGSSSWLIGSSYDRTILKNKLNIEIQDMKISDTICDELRTGNVTGEFEKSLKLYSNIKDLCLRENCNFLSIKCFDLLSEISTTGCVAVSKLNDEGLITSCEGDIPALISMLLAEAYFKITVFMANPSRISLKDNSVVFAHCTIPLSITQKVEYLTHYESDEGVAIKGDIIGKEFLIFKINGSMSDFRLFSGIKRNYEFSNKRCRTQVNLKLNENVEEILESPIGNHMIIIPAKNNRLKEFHEFLKLFL